MHLEIKCCKVNVEETLPPSSSYLWPRFLSIHRFGLLWVMEGWVLAHNLFCDYAKKNLGNKETICFWLDSLDKSCRIHEMDSWVDKVQILALSWRRQFFTWKEEIHSKLWNLRGEGSPILQMLFHKIIMLSNFQIDWKQHNIAR